MTISITLFEIDSYKMTLVDFAHYFVGLSTRWAAKALHKMGIRKMPVRVLRISIMLLVVIGFVLLQTACNRQEITTEPKSTTKVTATIEIPSETPTPTVAQSITPQPTDTSFPTETSTPTPTIDTTQQTWRETAIAIQKTTSANWGQARNEKATQVAQFPPPCDEMSFPSNVSPDGKWLAASCGRKRDETLVVQNKERTKWTLNFGDFLHPDTPDDIWGSLKPIFWGLDGRYLFFSKTLGYDGGGNQCFHGYGTYGLFRLDLRTGHWVTLVSPRDIFPGIEIKFSPTGEYYAITMDGITVTNLKTGEITQIEELGVMGMEWSPDGQYLAYSVASCGESTVEISSIYIWHAITDQTTVLLTIDEMLLRPQYWVANSILRFEGEQWVDLDNLYTIFDYDLTQEEIIFSGTATPSP